MMIIKMEPSNFSVALSMLVFGLSVGYSVGTILSHNRVQNLKDALQKSINLVFESDKKIDKLTEDYNTVSEQYNLLREASDDFVNSLKNNKILPPPSKKIKRCEQYVDDSDCEQNFHFPETPTFE